MDRKYLIVLVGIPGSGKSSLCSQLKENLGDIIPIMRVNQDSINNKKKGTREMCVKACKSALEGPGEMVVLIDRTNLDSEQRAVFVEIGERFAAEKICIVLDLPTKECGYHASQRKDHEGGVQGQRAFPIAFGAAKRLVLPQLCGSKEGFEFIFHCTNLEHVQKVLETICGHIKLGNGDFAVFKSLESWLAKEKAVSRIKEGGVKNSEGDEPQKKKMKQNVFQMMMEASKAQSRKGSIENREQTGSDSKMAIGSHVFKKFPGSNILSLIAADPSHLAEEDCLYVDQMCVMLKDKFPKAKFHALVLARSPKLLCPQDIRSAEDLEIVKHMKSVAIKVMNDNGIPKSCKIGFHSVPSLPQLHMHVVSLDFNSPMLKTKVHWNSFTQKDFFIDCRSTINLDMFRYNAQEKAALLKSDMHCPVCGIFLKNMPDAKLHYYSEHQDVGIQ
eukprot:jgi/Picsp_1/1933/NSC_05399-R1_fha-hit protein